MKLQTSLIFLTVVFLPVMALSQDEPKPNSIKLEAGLGGTIAGQGAGLSGRLAFGFISHKWGAMVRSTAGDGGQGAPVKRSGFSPYNHKTESFNDKAILVSRVISKTNKKPQVIASIGIGSFAGEKLSESKKELIPVDNTIGLAYEIGTATTGHIVGLSSRLYGNINKEAVYLGVAFSITLQGRW